MTGIGQHHPQQSARARVLEDVGHVHLIRVAGGRLGHVQLEWSRIGTVRGGGDHHVGTEGQPFAVDVVDHGVDASGTDVQVQQTALAVTDEQVVTGQLHSQGAPTGVRHHLRRVVARVDADDVAADGTGVDPPIAVHDDVLG